MVKYQHVEARESPVGSATALDTLPNPEPPLIRALTVKLVAFVADRPGTAVRHAVHATRGSGAVVLAVAPESEQAFVESCGARWASLTEATQPSERWAKKYRHSSSNAIAYERFCLQRWLVLAEAIRPLSLPDDAGIIVLDSDILLFRDPVAWVRELAGTPEVGGSQVAWLMGNAIQLHSAASLHRVGLYLHQLYYSDTTTLAAEIERYGSPAQPLPSAADRRTIYPAIVDAHAANRNRTGGQRIYHHFSDVQALAALCERSSERSIPAELSVRCSGTLAGDLFLRWSNRSDSAVVRSRRKVRWERRKVRWERPIPGLGLNQSSSCSTCGCHYVVHVGMNSNVHFLAPAPQGKRPSTEVRSLRGSHIGWLKELEEARNFSSEAAGWASLLRWRVGSPVPLIADGVGGLHALCLAHMQGPGAKEAFLERWPESTDALSSLPPPSPPPPPSRRQRWSPPPPPRHPVNTSCFAGAALPISDAHALIFVHIAKAGGSTIERSSLFADRRLALGGRYVGGHHRASKYAHAPGCEGYHKFAMVRHPCSRLLSLWSYYAQQLGKERDIAWARTRFTEASMANLTKFLIEVRRSNGAGWNWHHHQHFQTQAHMLGTENGTECGVDQVLPLERWAESMGRLAAARPGLDTSSLLGAHTLTSSHRSCAASYSATAWALMADMYAFDFCVLGYEARPEAELSAPAAATLRPEDITARLRSCRTAVEQRV